MNFATHLLSTLKPATTLASLSLAHASSSTPASKPTLKVRSTETI